MAAENVEEEEFLDRPELVLVRMVEKKPAQLVAVHEIAIAALLRGAECALFLRPEPAGGESSRLPCDRRSPRRSNIGGGVVSERVLRDRQAAHFELDAVSVRLNPACWSLRRICGSER